MRVALMHRYVDPGKRPLTGGAVNHGAADEFTRQIIDVLSSKGIVVDILVAEDRVWDLENIKPEYDMYVLKSKSPLTLALACLFEMEGALVVNTWESSSLAKNKVASTAVLAAHNIPVPSSWATWHSDSIVPLLADGPVWIKPFGGSKGKGVCCVETAEDMQKIAAPADAWGLPLPQFAQRNIEHAGRDIKVYVVGDMLWSISRPWPAVTMEDKLGRPAEISDEIRKTALACGKALGLELYGVDFLVSGDKFFVVDVNAFPGYKGIPDAPRSIAEYLYKRVSTGKSHPRSSRGLPAMPVNYFKINNGAYPGVHKETGTQ